MIKEKLYISKNLLLTNPYPYREEIRRENISKEENALRVTKTCYRGCYLSPKEEEMFHNREESLRNRLRILRKRL